MSPSATKATISAMLASAPKKLWISGLYGVRSIAEQDPGDEHRQKPRSVDHGRQAVDHEDARESAQRIEALGRQGYAAREPQHQAASDDAGCAPDDHLEGERTERVPGRRRRDVAGRQETGHHGDTNRVVGAGLALQDDTASTGDLSLAEHREDDGRIGRCDGGSEQQGLIPADVQDPSGKHGDCGCGEDGADEADA